MLKNIENNQSTQDDRPVLDSSHELKWKRTDTVSAKESEGSIK